MTNELYAVFGGELTDPSEIQFRNPDKMDFVGFFPDRPAADRAWQAKAWETVDNALMRYFIMDVNSYFEFAKQSNSVKS